MLSINTSVYGEDPETMYFTKSFQYSNYDDEVFVASARQVKEKIDKNLPININETLLLFASYVIISLNENKSIEKIQNDALDILSPHQVMIGVPEMMQKVEFIITVNQNSTSVTLHKPIESSRQYTFQSM